MYPPQEDNLSLPPLFSHPPSNILEISNTLGFWLIDERRSGDGSGNWLGGWVGHGYFLEIFICSGFFPRTVAFSRRGWAGLGCVEGRGG